MSLVHEALQKAEREKQRKLGAAASAPTPLAPPPPIATPVIHAPVVIAPTLSLPLQTAPPRQAAPGGEPAHSRNFLLPSLIGCVAIVAIIAIVFLASNASSVLRQSKESAPAVAAIAPAPAVKSTLLVEPQPAASTPADAATAPSVAPPPAPVIDESKYKLSGIMKDPDGKPVAVVNGHVLYEGFSVEGATVKKIDTDHVTLDVRGHDVVLRLF